MRPPLNNPQRERAVKDLMPNKNAPRKSERKKIRRKRKRLRGNSPEVSKRAAERHSFAVYSGQNWLGSVEQRGDAFTAKTIKGKKIGIFGNLKRAADAISDTAEAAA